MTERVFNLLELAVEEIEDAPPGHRFGRCSVTEAVGATRTGLGVYALEPGEATWPYHFELSEEEWLIVLEGELTVRTPEGEQRLRAGDVVCFPVGVAGAHAARNDGAVKARYAMPSSRAEDGDGAVYPDSGTFVVRTAGFRHRGRLGEELEYWEAES